uniref:FPL domain-containing protein n=1 Tax=Parastrongyloides trichosuri TaxID=131310 RepID=A0A0N4Z705_PARTI
MFWSEEDTSKNEDINGTDEETKNSRPINEILDNEEGVNFYDVLKNNNCVSELLSLNQKLLDYFTKDEIMLMLMYEILFTEPQHEDTNEDISIENRYAYSKRALNIFCSFQQKTLTKYLDNDDIVTILAEYLLGENESQNSLTTSFYISVIDRLFRECFGRMLENLKTTRLLEGLLRNIKYSSVVEFFSNILFYTPQINGRVEMQEICDNHHITERLFVIFSRDKDVTTYNNAGQILTVLADQLRDMYRTATNVNEDFLLGKIYNKEQWGKLLKIITDKDNTNVNVCGPICEMLSNLLNIFYCDENPSNLYNYNSSKDQQDISGVVDKLEYDKIDELLRNRQHCGDVFKYDICRSISMYTGKLFVAMKSMKEKKNIDNDKVCSLYMTLLASIFNCNDSITHKNAMESLYDDEIVGAVFEFLHSLSYYATTPIMQCAFKDFIRNILFYANENGEPVLIDLFLNTFSLGNIILDEIGTFDNNVTDQLQKTLLSFYISTLKIIYDAANYSCRKSLIEGILIEKNIYSKMEEAFKKHHTYLFKDILNDSHDAIEHAKIETNKPKKKITHVYPNGTYPTYSEEDSEKFFIDDVKLNNAPTNTKFGRQSIISRDLFADNDEDFFKDFEANNTQTFDENEMGFFNNPFGE